MTNIRKQLVRLIANSDFEPVKGVKRTIGSQFTSLFIETIADHLIANGVTIQKWIPVNERIPDLDLGTWKDEDGSVGSFEASDWVWGVDCNGDMFEVKYETGPVFNGWYAKNGKVYAITHWMPLPKLPKEE